MATAGRAGKVGCHEFTKRAWSASPLRRSRMGMLGSPRPAAQAGTETEPSRHRRRRARGSSTTSSTGRAPTARPATRWSRTRWTIRTSTAPQPTMLPGQTFEVNAVLADPSWPGCSCPSDGRTDRTCTARSWSTIRSSLRPTSSSRRGSSASRTIRCTACCSAVPRWTSRSPRLHRRRTRRPDRLSPRLRPPRLTVGRFYGPPTRGCPPIPRPAGRRRETTAPSHRRMRRCRRAPRPRPAA